MQKLGNSPAVGRVSGRRCRVVDGGSANVARHLAAKASQLSETKMLGNFCDVDQVRIGCRAARQPAFSFPQNRGVTMRLMAKRRAAEGTMQILEVRKTAALSLRAIRRPT